MKKFLAAVLAMAMVFSVCSFPVSAAEVPAVPDESVFYGIGASGFNISVDVTETSTVAHTAGNTITYSVTITNRGGDITKGNHLKVQLYNTSTNLADKEIFDKTKLDFPTHNPRFTISGPTATGVICKKTNPTTSVDGQKFSYDYDKDVNKDLLMAAGASVTFNMSYTIKEDDIEQGYMRNLIVVYLGDTQGQYAVGKYVQATFIDESVNVGTLTISNIGGGGKKAEIYTVRLADATYTTPPTVTTDITFVNGVATIRLDASGSVTGVIPAGDYTVTVSNAGDKDVSYTVDGGSSVTGKSYSGHMTMGGTCRIEFTFTESTAADNYQLTYHFNAPSGYSPTSADVTRGQSVNEFAIEDVCDVFTDLSGRYYIEHSGKTYYFCGWDADQLGTNAAFSSIDYPVTYFSGSTRGFVNSGTFTVKDMGEPGSGTDKLYAVWLENPGLMGYSMAVQGGHFISRTQTGDQMLGDNGLSGNKAQKFVVYDNGHLFDKNHTDMLTATVETPTLSGYTFVTWFNKSAQRVYNADSVNPTNDPNQNYIVQPGETLGFGDTSNIYSLDAVWGRVEGAVDKEFPFDGTAHQIGVDDLQSFIWGAEYNDNGNEKQHYIPNTVFKNLFGVTVVDGTRQAVTPGKITYTYTVTKNGRDVTSEATTVVNGVPQFTEPGVYEYTIKAELKGVDPSNGKNTGSVDLTIGTVSATLTITPVESLTVTKYVRNGEDPDEEFTFSVSLSGVAEDKTYSYRLLDADGEQIKENTYTVTGGAATVTVELKDEESVVFDNLPNETTYSVEETNLRTGYKQSVTGNKTGTITESNKEVTVVFTNTYETNDLTIGKEVPYSSDTTQFTFTVTLTDAKGDALPGSFVYTGSKEGSIASGGTVTLANGETVTIHDLPVGASYSIVETAVAGYITPVSPVTGTITAAAGKADFTNYKLGSLTVTKEFKLNEGIEPDNRQLPADWNTREVTFRVTFNPPEHTPDFTVSYNGTSKLISGATGGYIEFTLTKDTYTTGCTISGIPYGVGYEVLETAVGGVSDGHYVPLYNGRTTGSGEMNADSKTVNCVNTYHLVPEGYGALVVKKDVVGVTSQTEFTFRVTFSGSSFPVGFEKVQTFTLKNGEYKLLNVPHGVSYLVEEVFVEGETRPTKILPIFEEPTREEDDVVSGETAKGTITVDFSNDSVLFSNQYLSGMTVKKEVEVAEGSVGPNSGKAFTFTVNFTGNKEYANLRVEYSVNGGAKNLITKPGSVTITLKAGDTVRFEGVPVGASHIITEAESSRGDEVRITVDGVVETANGYSSTGTIDADGMTVVFMNVYNTPVTPPSSEETDPTDPPTDPTNPPTDPTNPPTDPTDPPIPDDPDEPKPPTPPALNGEDHFGYIVGYPGDVYVRPNNPITRAELVSILFRLLKDEVREQYRPETTYVSFSDVNRASWYSLAVGTLKKMGIISGYEDGTFRPDRYITRAEMAVIVAKFFENSEDTYFSDFTDVPQDAWYARYVSFAKSIGLMVGNGDGTFGPNTRLSRAEAMAVFNRLLGRTPTRDSFERVADEMKTWADNANPNLWYYADVQEATNSHEFEIVDGYEVWTEITEMIDWTKLNESYQNG